MVRKLILVMLIWSWVFDVAAAQADASKRCEMCGAEIEGVYYTFQKDGTTVIVCSECTQSLARCEMCGIPVRNTRSGQTGVFCHSCLLKAKKCAVCGRPLAGKYYADNHNRVYCPECYQNADRCAVCNDILRPGEWRRINNQLVCDTCARIQPRCHGCGAIIVGPVSSYIGYDGESFCQQCVKNSPSCISCLRPCGPHPVRMKNGNCLCRDCATTAIRDANQLESIVTQVARHLETGLLMTINHHVSFKLVDIIDYDRASNQYRESGRFIQVGDDFTVKILLGLSRPLCIETVAHELAHAWQAENCPHLPNDELIEGFAQWVAAHTLSRFGYRSLIDRLGEREDVYGRGYRRMIEMERSLGFNGVFRELIRLGNPPR
ncbi:hypothetical protein JXA80_12240 [bacterium]|nr:hypothetical protein [candidate division CSSED10-310 bacterium]